MLSINAMPADEVPCFIAEQCRLLCNNGSESQGMFDRISMRSLREGDYGAMIAYAWKSDDLDGPIVVAWACVSEWPVGDEVRIQAQGFVAPDYRRRGIALALCVCLTHDLPLESLPVAVFSPEFFRIAKRLNWNATEYALVDDGWIGVGTVERREV
jgi:GNAT superfamily N-acetyltransferase